jgi:hypothetical protein
VELPQVAGGVPGSGSAMAALGWLWGAFCFVLALFYAYNFFYRFALRRFFGVS